MENTLPTQPVGASPASAIPSAQPVGASSASDAPSVSPVASAAPTAQPVRSAQPVQPAPTAQPTSKSGKKLDQTKILMISLAVLGALILLLGASNIIALLIPRNDNIPVANTSDTGEGSSESTEPEVNQPVEKKPLEELSKEEALAAFQNMNKVNYAPSGLFDPEMEKKIVGHYLTVGVSYDFLEDIAKNDTVVSNSGVYSLDVEEMDDTYSVYYPMQDDKRVDSFTIGIAFEKSHLNYFKEKVIDTDDEGYATISYKNVARYNDLSADFIKKSMPVLAVAEGVVNTGSIYDFAYSEDDEKVLLTLYNIKLELMEGETNDDGSPKYELILYIDECYIGKNSFEFGWITDENDEVDYIINTFPLEQADVDSLSAAG